MKDYKFTNQFIYMQSLKHDLCSAWTAFGCSTNVDFLEKEKRDVYQGKVVMRNGSRDLKC